MKKILSVLLVAAMMITVMPDNCFATNLPNVRPDDGYAGFYGDKSGYLDQIAYDTYYKCNGTSITTDADEDDYNLYFDNNNKKLIFNNFNSSGYLIVPAGITIEFKGENSLTDSGGSIEVDGKNGGDVTICGDGTLDANYGFEYLDKVKGNVKIEDNVTLNFMSSGVSTYDGSITICGNAEVNVMPPSSTNGYAFYTNSNSDDVSADLVITDNAQVTTRNSSIKSDSKIEISGDAVVDVETKLYAEEIDIKDNAQVTAAGMNCFYGNITIDSTKETILTDGIDVGTSYNQDRYEIKIYSDLKITDTQAYQGCGISMYVGKVIIGNGEKKVNVDITSNYLGIYLYNAELDIHNANVSVEGEHAVYGYQKVDVSQTDISIANSTVTVNGSNRAFSQEPDLSYDNGYRVMAGESEEAAQIIDGFTDDEEYKNHYVKIEPMPEYTLNLTAPSKTVYTTGEELDITGAKLELSYEDGVTQDITLTEDMITGFDSTKEGTQILTVTYGDKKAQFDVTVIDLSNTYTTNLNANGMTNEDFAITAKAGYAISDAENGEFGDTLNVLEGTGTYSFYVKHEESDTVFGPVSVDYEVDRDAPVIGNIKDGAIYYTTQKVTVEDKNLDTVTVNDASIEGDITLAGNTDTTYTITAKDKAGNETTVIVTMKSIASLTEEIKDITEENVNSDNRNTVEQIRENLSNLVTDNEAEKEEINKAIENCENLIDKIEGAENAGNTENIDKVENIIKDNVVLTDKDDLEQAKEDLEKALDEYGNNYTDDEKQEIQDKITQIDEALEIIHKVEAVIEKIDNLPTPDTVTTDDKEKADEAKTALDKLSDYEKSLVNKEATEKLDKVLERIKTLKQGTTTPQPTPMETTTPQPTPTETTTKSILSASKAVVTKKKKISVSWNKIKDADGYDVFVILCGKKISKENIAKSVKGSKVSATIKKLNGKKINSNGNYKVKVRAYKLVNGKKKYVASTFTYHIAGNKNKKYTNAKKIKVSSTKVSLKVNENKKVTAKVVKQDKEKKLLPKKHGSSVRYFSSNKAIAVVNSKGKITAKSKGTCYVYAVALNGVQKKIKVTVK